MSSLVRSAGTESLTGIHWFAGVLATLTGIIHLYVGVVDGRPPITLAGIGFFVGMAVVLLGYRRRRVYIAGIVYTVLQIVLWAVNYGIVEGGAFTAVGILDKVVQLALVGALVYLYRYPTPDTAL